MKRYPYDEVWAGSWIIGVTGVILVEVLLLGLFFEAIL